MGPKFRLYRPEFVNFTNIDFERSFISWESISCHGSGQRIRVEVGITFCATYCLYFMSIETSKQDFDSGKELPSLPTFSFICFLSLKPHQARYKINIGHQYLSFVALYSHLLREDIYLPFIITPVYIMEPSHILFVISNVDKRYVCLCGIQVNNKSEPQDCAIRRCLRVLRIFDAAENRTPIYEELLYTKTEAGRRDGQIMHHQHIYTYPYITTCLALGVSFNPDIAYHSGYSSGVLKTGTLFEENDSDISGFTAIDITDTRALRYCFLKFAEDPDTGSAILTPLSADRYVKAYEDQPRESEDVLKTLCAEFQHFQLIASNDLQQIWPHIKWKKTIQPSERNNNGDYGYRNEIAYDGGDEVGEDDCKVLPGEGKDGDDDVDKDEDEALQNLFLNPFGCGDDSQQHNRAVVLLSALESRAGFNAQRTDVSFLRAIGKDPNFLPLLSRDLWILMNRGTNLHCSRPARWLLEKCFHFQGGTQIPPRMKEKLWLLASGFPPSQLALFFLANFFEDELNLCIFTTIGFHDLIGSNGLLQQIRKARSKQNRKMSTLNLSRSAINPLILSKILEVTPEIKNLYLMHTPCLPIQSVQDVLARSSTKIDNLYHTDLFAPFVASLTLGLNKELCENMKKKMQPPFEQYIGRLASSELFKHYFNNIVTQMICIYTLHESFKRLVNEDSERFDWQMFPMETLEATLQEEREQAQRETKKLPAFALETFPLHDTHLSSARIVTGLAQFATFCLSDRLTRDRFHLYGHVLASCFARAAQVPTQRPTFTVGPPPLTIACNDRRYCTRWQTPTTTPDPLTIRKGYCCSILVVKETLPPARAGKCSITEQELKWRYAFIVPKKEQQITASPKQSSPAKVTPEKPQFHVLDMITFLRETNCTEDFSDLYEFWNNFCLQHEGRIEVLGKKVAHALLAKMEGVGKKFW